MDFPKCRLKELREAAGLTQIELAEQLGMDVKTIRSLEKCQSTSLVTAAALAEHFNISIDYLLGLAEEKHVENKKISETTGLTDESIEVLRFLNIHSKEPNNAAWDFNKLQLDTINKVLSSSETHCFDDREPEDYICFSVFEYIGKYIGLSTSTINGQSIVTIDNEDISEGCTTVKSYFANLKVGSCPIGSTT